MPAALPTLFPRPRELSRRDGFLPIPAQPHATAQFLANLPATIAEAQAALAVQTSAACRSECSAHLGADSYTLAIRPDGILLQASGAAGLLYGAQTLRQIHAQNPDALPCLEILDGPDLPVRGFMLDVSRCKVPTQAELLALIRALGQLRVNQLQLYVEHTFAFPGFKNLTIC